MSPEADDCADMTGCMPTDTQLVPGPAPSAHSGSGFLVSHRRIPGLGPGPRLSFLTTVLFSLFSWPCLLSIPTFRSRFGSHTDVQYYPGSIAAKEPYTLDIINENKDAPVVTQAHLNIPRFKIKNGQLALKPSPTKKILKVSAAPEDLEATQERQLAMQKL